MDVRKYMLVVTTALSIFLFTTGLFFFVYTRQLAQANTPASAVHPFQDILDPFLPISDSVNILVLGGDKVGANTDTMLLVNYNPSTADMSILSIPRDTKVAVKGSSIPKINSAFAAGGDRLAVETVGKLLNVSIKYYAYIDTSAFREVVNLLDGVDYFVPVDMNYDDPLQNLHIHLSKGQQHLNGEQAEQFMRFRQPSHYTDEIMKYYDGSDLKRIDAQQNFIREVIRQKTSIKYIGRLNSIIQTAFSKVKTDISAEEALKLSSNLGKLNYNEINMLKLPGQSSQEEGGWYFIVNRTECDQIIRQYFDTKATAGGGKTNQSNTTRTGNTAAPGPQKTGGNKNQGQGSASPTGSKTPVPTPASSKTAEPASITESPTPSPTPALSPTPSPSADFLKDNPSNAETDMSSSVSPMP